MGVSKATKEKIMDLLLQRMPTDEIAKRLGYSVGTVRNVFEELREEHGVDTTKEIADMYLNSSMLKELMNLKKHIEISIKKLKRCNFTPKKNSDMTGKTPKIKNKKNKKSETCDTTETQTEQKKKR